MGLFSSPTSILVSSVERNSKNLVPTRTSQVIAKIPPLIKESFPGFNKRTLEDRIWVFKIYWTIFPQWKNFGSVASGIRSLRETK